MTATAPDRRDVIEKRGGYVSPAKPIAKAQLPKAPSGPAPGSTAPVTKR